MREISVSGTKSGAFRRQRERERERERERGAAVNVFIVQCTVCAASCIVIKGPQERERERRPILSRVHYSMCTT